MQMYSNVPIEAESLAIFVHDIDRYINLLREEIKRF